MAEMASGGSLPCSGPQVGRCTPSGSSASGGGRGLRSHSSNRNGAGGGATTDPASVSGRAGLIASGPMTSSWIEHTSDPRSPDGRKFLLLTVTDEVARRCMAVVVERRLNSDNVLLGPCTPLSDRALRPTWPAGSYPFRQRLGVYRSCRPRPARQDRRRPSIWLRADRRRRRRKPRKGVALGAGSPWENGYERELQLKAPARNPEHGDLLYTEGGQSADRTMAASL